MVSLLTSVAHKWREIGLSLVLTPDAIDAIDESSDSDGQKLIDVILLWEDSKTRPFTWDSLLIVLNSEIGRTDVNNNVL